MIIIRYLILLFFLSPIYCIGQVVDFQPSDFYNLHIEENNWSYSRNDYNDSEVRLVEANYVYYGTDTLPTIPERLNVVIDTFLLDTVTNGINLKGFVKGRWYGAKSEVRIWVGVASEVRRDTVWVRNNRIDRTYIDGVLVTEDKVPLYTHKRVDIYERYNFLTPVDYRDDGESKPFDISFIVGEDDVIVFGLQGNCYAEIYEIGRILNYKNIVYKKW